MKCNQDIGNADYGGSSSRSCGRSSVELTIMVVKYLLMLLRFRLFLSFLYHCSRGMSAFIIVPV